MKIRVFFHKLFSQKVWYIIDNTSPEHSKTTWIGGSITASLTSFKKVFILKEEYQSNVNIIFQLDDNMKI